MSNALHATIDISKLPKWAQGEIVYLRRKIEEQQALIDTLTTAPLPESMPVSWHDLDFNGSLPERAEIRFKTPEGRIDVSMRNGCLRVSGHRSIRINPQATNVIHVRVGENE